MEGVSQSSFTLPSDSNGVIRMRDPANESGNSTGGGSSGTRSSENSSSGFSRRAFLRGSSAAAAAAAMVARPETASAQKANQGAEVVSGFKTITLSVNVQKHQVNVEPRTTLLEVLRYQLDLTGAKPVSQDGSSGASTVLIDGRPVMASTTLAIACEGKQIQTVESFGGAQPDSAPVAFVQHDAQQCGFCTPGFVVAARAFLDKHPHATEEEIRQGLNGNICRCGTYANVIQAVLSATKGG